MVFTWMITGKYVKFDINPVKQSFYTASQKHATTFSTIILIGVRLQ